MAKQLLLYESAVPLSRKRHGALSIEPGRDYGFSAAVNAVPLMTVEFARAAGEYAIVFAAAEDEVLPVAVLGVRPDRNLYLSADAQWTARYVPAFIRRYPFVLSSSGDMRQLTVCIDESCPALNRDGRGMRLFGDDGKPGVYVQQALAFLHEYHVHFERTKAFGRRLKELGLLEPMRAQMAVAPERSLSLGGFMVVSRARLNALDDQALALLVRDDEIELIFLHLHSLRNLNDITQRLIASLRGRQETRSAHSATA